MKGPCENIAIMVADLQDLPSYLDEHLRRDLKGEVPLGLKPYVDLLRNPARAYDKIMQLMTCGRTEDAQGLYDFLLRLFKEAHLLGLIGDEYFRFINEGQLRTAREEIASANEQDVWDMQATTWANARQLLS